LSCMRFGIVVIKQYPSCQLASTFSATCIPKFQQNPTVRRRFHIFTMLLKNGLAVLPDNP
jgi:hypothetical protein